MRGTLGCRLAARARPRSFLRVPSCAGLADDDVIAKAAREGWILITNDKDFGDKVFRDARLHRGVLLLRLDDERPANKINVISRVLRQFGDRLAGAFVVATESHVRFATRQPRH